MAGDAQMAVPDVQVCVACAKPDGEPRVSLVTEERDASGLLKELFVLLAQSLTARNNEDERRTQ
eukprot:1030809-Alexandrium_andersonii.AAC.2